MDVIVRISKEKKIEDFRMVIIPSGRSEIGLIRAKNYGIIAYPNKKDFEKYKKVIEKIQDYTQLKNKIEFNDLNLLQSLIFRILHRLAGYTSLWERDLQFKLKGEFPEDKYIDEIFNSDGNNNQKYKHGGITDKYANFLIEKEEGKRAGKNKVKKRSERERSFIIRNYIAHFNYIPDAEKSILEILEELRELLKYDRKLKNAVMKCNIKSSKRLFNVALTLFAVSPIIEKIDMLYYACMFLSISLCIIAGVLVIKKYRKDHNNILKLCLNDKYEDLYLMLICVVGIAIGYLMENFSHVHIFSVFFV